MFGLEAIGVNSIIDFAVLLAVLAVFIYYLGRFASSASSNVLDREDLYIKGFAFLLPVGLGMLLLLLILSVFKLTTDAVLAALTIHAVWAFIIILLLWVVAYSFLRYMARCEYEQVVPAASPYLLRSAATFLSIIAVLFVIAYLYSSNAGATERLLVLVSGLPLLFVFAKVYGFASWKVTLVNIHLPKGIIQGQLVRSDEKETVILKNGRIQRIKNLHISRIEFL